MKTMEKWKVIDYYQGHEFSGKYEVSSWGNVRDVKTKTPLAFFSNNRGHGYLCTRIQDKKGIRAVIKIHRLVAFYFLQKIEGKDEVNHKDGNVKNNSYTNLEWVTHTENMAHAKKNFLQKDGE